MFRDRDLVRAFAAPPWNNVTLLIDDPINGGSQFWRLHDVAARGKPKL
jgi:hypothetical protein